MMLFGTNLAFRARTGGCLARSIDLADGRGIDTSLPFLNYKFSNTIILVENGRQNLKTNFNSRICTFRKIGDNNVETYMYMSRIHAKSCSIGVWDLFIWGGGGCIHIFGPLCPNHESMPEFPPALKISLSGGRGGGELVHLFCLPARPKSVLELLYSRIGLGVHDIPQVLPAKIIDKQKNIYIKKPPEFARIPPY